MRAASRFDRKTRRAEAIVYSGNGELKGEARTLVVISRCLKLVQSPRRQRQSEEATSVLSFGTAHPMTKVRTVQQTPTSPMLSFASMF